MKIITLRGIVVGPVAHTGTQEEDSRLVLKDIHLDLLVVDCDPDTNHTHCVADNL